MYESEKNFLERIADRIPGLRGYREKEARRDTDKRLRDYLAAEIDRLRRSLDGMKRALLDRGQLAPLDEADRVARKLQKSADSLRFASYGYAGFFDQVKVREQELDRIYEHDTALVAEVRALDQQIAASAGAPDTEAALRELESTVDRLNESIEKRKHIFDTPA